MTAQPPGVHTYLAASQPAGRSFRRSCVSCRAGKWPKSAPIRPARLCTARRCRCRCRCLIRRRRPVPSRPVRPMPSRAVPSVPCRPVPCRAVPFRSVPSRSVPFRSVPSRPVPSRPVPVRPVSARPVRAIPPRPVPSRPGWALSRASGHTTLWSDAGPGSRVPRRNSRTAVTLHGWNSLGAHHSWTNSDLLAMVHESTTQLLLQIIYVGWTLEPELDEHC